MVIRNAAVVIAGLYKGIAIIVDHELCGMWPYEIGIQGSKNVMVTAVTIVYDTPFLQNHNRGHTVYVMCPLPSPRDLMVLMKFKSVSDISWLW